MSEQRIFEEALERDVGLRAHYLEEACGSDSELRRRIEHLLKLHEGAGEFFEKPAAEIVATIDQPVTEKLGTQIGPYKLREKIGEGGMGVVYVAEQTAPVKRKVALKIIKPGMNSKDVIARFEAERQALAMMDHPNIAKVHDGGATDTGQPYFVMELVQGLAITDYSDEYKLSTVDRLKLFAKVCRAVQHAHQKGIIHRDLKPSNIIVSEIDATAVPKVIDFGVSKAVGHTLTDATLYTQFSQMVGTPLYMSPEQAGLGVVDVDTRSDVYSLGVLLYELLTSNTPFDSETLKRAGFDEMRRIIREDEPLKPSAMVSTLKAAALSTISQRRGSDPRKLSESLSGELDWLVMKALEKDRNRRYESASSLAADVERYLNQEPIAAGPPSLTYRFRKYAQRNKVKLAAISLVAASLLIAAIVAGGAALKAQQERREVVQAVQQLVSDAETAIEAGDLELARERIDEAHEQIAESQRELKQLSAVVDHLSGKVTQRIREQSDFDQFKKLAAEVIDGTEELSPAGKRRTSETIHEALSIYGVLDGQQWHEPLDATSLSAAQVQEVKERAYELLLYLAYAYWEDLKLSDHSEPAEALRLLSVAASFHEPTRGLHWLRGEFQEALGQAAEAKQSRRLMEASPGVMAVDYFFPARSAPWVGDYQAAFDGYEAALRIQPNHFQTLFFYGVTLAQSGNPKEATDLFRACVALKPDHSLALVNYAVTLQRNNRTEEAIYWFRKCIEVHPEAVEPRIKLACLYECLGKNEDAVTVYDEFLQAWPHHFAGREGFDVARLYSERAGVHYRRLHLQEALADIDLAIATTPEYPIYHLNRAIFLRLLNETEQALVSINRAIELQKANKDADEQELAPMLGHRALIYADLANRGQAIDDINSALRLADDNVSVCNNAALLYLSRAGELRDLPRAVEFATKAVELSPENIGCLFTLGLAQYRSENWQASLNACQRALEELNRPNERSESHPSILLLTAMAQFQLGHRAESLNSFNSAIEWLQVRDANDDLHHLLAEARKSLGVDEESPRSESESEVDSEALPVGDD